MRYHAHQSVGFTLVEVLVSLGIFAMLTGVVLSNYRGYNTNAFFSNASEDIVLALRQAQVYGVGVKGNVDVSGNPIACPPFPNSAFNCSYGAFFWQGSHGITVFSDNNSTGYYDPTEQFSPLLVGASVAWELPISISDLSCGGNPCLDGVSVIFKRPAPDAFIRDSSLTIFPFVTITIRDANTGKTASVTITSAGQISLQP